MNKCFNYQNIRTLLIEGFTDTELRRLCYDLPDFRSVYDDLTQNIGKAGIIDKLIEFTDRRLEMETLLSLVKIYNPARYEMHQPYYSNRTTNNDGYEKPQSQTEERASHLSVFSGKTKVEIKIQGDPSTFTDEQKSNLLKMLAVTLECPIEWIKILSVRNGSIILEVEMPKEVADRLITLYNAGEISVLKLGIEHVILLSESLPASKQSKEMREKFTFSQGPLSTGGRNIYVGNLAWGVADEELRRAFEGFGKVISAIVIRDKATGKSRGFGFVEMANSIEAEAAINGLDGADLKGRAIQVNRVRPSGRGEWRSGRPIHKKGSGNA